MEVQKAAKPKKQDALPKSSLKPKRPSTSRPKNKSVVLAKQPPPFYPF
jgi:hypothetical protein